MATVRDKGGTQKHWIRGQPFVGLAKRPTDTGGAQRYWVHGQPGYAVLKPRSSVAFIALF